MKKIIHIKLLDDTTTLEDVNKVAEMMTAWFKERKLNKDYHFLVTSNLYDVNVTTLDELIETLQKMKRGES